MGLHPGNGLTVLDGGTRLDLDLAQCTVVRADDLVAHAEHVDVTDGVALS